MKEDLEQFIESARWFGGKGRDATVADVRRIGSLGSAEHDGTPFVGIELVTLEYADGQRETYQVPIAYYAAPQGRLEHALIGEWEDPDLGPVHAYDAMHDRDVTILWLQAFDSGLAQDRLTFHRLPGHELDMTTHSTLFSGEQSNSSIAFGEDSLMKLFRKVTPGHNPDIEIHAKLTEAGSEHIAALYGWVEGRTDEGAQGEPLHLAMLQQFLRTASDGWDLALASVRDLYAEADLHADEVGGDFAAESQRLGVAVGEVHRDLARGFPTSTWDAWRSGCCPTARGATSPGCCGRSTTPLTPSRPTCRPSSTTAPRSPIARTSGHSATSRRSSPATSRRFGPTRCPTRSTRRPRPRRSRRC